MDIKRDLYPYIKDHLPKPEITLIVGPRQAGKTTICRQLQADCEKTGEHTWYLNLDIESDFALFSSQEQLLFAIRNRFGNQKAVIIIDEFQRKENGGKFLKGLYDMQLPYKFVVTGSGSIELKESIHESLAGRKQIFEVQTLSFAEYLTYMTDYSYPDLHIYAQVFPDRMQLYLRNYLTFGGYPKVVLTEGIDEKRRVLEELYSAYLIKDITALLNVEKSSAFQKLVEAISILNGKLVNINQLANTIGLSAPTIDRYLWYLEQTYILHAVRPYSQNRLKEVTKAHTYYFSDIGLKNLVSAQFDPPADRVDLGFDFQNYVHNTIYHFQQQRFRFPIRFWRTHDGSEVDFVLAQGADPIGVECKYSALTQSSIPRAARNFIAQYQPSRFYIINTVLDETQIVGETSVRFIPFYRITDIFDVA